MQWVKYKLWPTFKQLHPGKLMIPCCDNAPYHHNRGIPSLSGITKKADLVNLIRNGVPGATASNGKFTGMPAGATITLSAVAGKRDAPVQVPVHGDDIVKDAKKNLPNVPTIPELKTGFLEAIKNDPALRKQLDCKLEKFVTEENATARPDVKLQSTEWSGTTWMLWTPPYSPTLQPIEEFWGAGKNYAASLYKNERKMKECVSQLQAGWYGDDGSGQFLNKERDGLKQKVDCADLVRRAIVEANKKAQLVGGLTGTVEAGLVHDGDTEKHPLDDGDGDTDMTIKHVELVDLTAPEEQETPAEPATLTEEQHEDDLAHHL
eukprot:COSAG02_NODE_8028_length_2741_cov_2.982967_1_plen_319_part_10